MTTQIDHQPVPGTGDRLEPFLQEIDTPSLDDSASRRHGLLDRVAGLGRPVIAIGGITAGRVGQVCLAGAYGVAAISALWQARDSGAAALELLSPWMDTDD